MRHTLTSLTPQAPARPVHHRQPERLVCRLGLGFPPRRLSDGVLKESDGDRVGEQGSDRLAWGNFTTRNHHLFRVVPDDGGDFEDWVEEHLRSMELDGFRLVAMTQTGGHGIWFAMTKVRD